MPVNKVAQIIADEIASRGPISFARFMELALFCPNYGYYEKESDTIGRRGDYFTSVSVGSLFGELLGLQFSAWLEEVLNRDTVRLAEAAGTQSGTDSVQIVEAGAHDGKLAADILRWCKAQRPELFSRLRYWIVEPSEQRRARQSRHLFGFEGKVTWAERLQDVGPSAWVRQARAHTEAPQPGSDRQPTGVRGIIFGNELLDSFPVHRLGWSSERRNWCEWGVTTTRDGFLWIRVPLAQGTPGESQTTRDRDQSPLLSQNNPVREGFLVQVPLLLQRLPGELLSVLPDGYSIEVCPAAEQWWVQAARLLRSGNLMTIDYGYSDEWLRPERTLGTLRAYRAHRPSADLLKDPGEQDITAHVNFGALMDHGLNEGLRTRAFCTQGEFLTEIAARAWQREAEFGEWNPRRTRQFQTLTHPEHLGRAFRVLVQEKTL